MSKLAEAIRRTLRSEAAPMGFGAARAAPKATMLVGALGAAAAGADIALLDGRARMPSASDLERAKADGAAVVGLRANDVDRESLAALRKAGLDFLVFEPDSTPAAALLDE